MTQKRLWIISELFYPEQTSTGYFLTKIASGLAPRWDVHAVAAQPTYSERGVVAPRTEVFAGIHIHRLRSTRFNKDRLLLRLVNFTTFSLSVLFFALLNFRRGDRVLLVTNPPFLVPIISAVSRWKGLDSRLLVHDVYPDVLLAAGMLGEGSLAHRAIASVFRWSAAGFGQIIVIGRDMQRRVARNSGRPVDQIPIITNWGDTDDIRPMNPADNPFVTELGLDGKVCVQFSGNIGRTHDVETLIAAAKQLRDDDQVCFLFIGYGGQADRVRSDIDALGLRNAIFLDRQPRERLGAMLACATAVVIPFNPGMNGISVPSRMYNVMAAGTPIIAMADRDSELAMTVDEFDAGWTIDSGNVEALVALIEHLKGSEGKSERDRKAVNARAAVLTNYRLSDVIEKFDNILAVSR